MTGGGVSAGWHHALVVFCDGTELWWLRLLRRGFRHCFVALAVEGGWIVVDPLSHVTVVAHFPIGQEFDLGAWYRQQGLTVVCVQKSSPERRVAPILPSSCVETVKRILGIHAATVWTPWQLYRYLNKSGTFSLTPS